MKMSKYVIILGAILALVTASFNVSAETDSTGDLFHAIGDGTYEIYNDAKDDIDITDISYTASDTQLTVTLTVDGTIQDEQLFGYFVYVVLEGTTGYNYWGSYTNGIGYVFDTTLSEHLVTKDSNTLTFTFDIDDAASVANVWAWAYELAAIGSEELWADWAPDSYFPAYALFYGEDDTEEEDTGEEDTGEEDTGEEETNGEETTGEDDTGDEEGGGGTPGFELLVLIAAIAVALIILRKRK